MTNNIQKVIEEGLKEFHYKFNVLGHVSVISCGCVVSRECECRETLESHISTTISNVLQAIESEVEGKIKKQPGYGLDNYEHQEADQVLGFNEAISDILALLKSARESIKSNDKNN